MAYHIKTFYSQRVYRFSYQEIPTYDEIQQKIEDYFQITDPIELSWVDDEGDKIQLKNDDDVEEAFTTTEPPTYICIYVCTITNTYQNICSPITTLNDSPVTTVCVDQSTTTTNTCTNTSEDNSITNAPIDHNYTNICPIENSPINQCTISDSPIYTNVIQVSDVNVITGNCLSENTCNYSPIINHILDHNHLIQMSAQQSSTNHHHHFSSSPPSSPSSPSSPSTSSPSLSSSLSSSASSISSNATDESAQSIPPITLRSNFSAHNPNNSNDDVNKTPKVNLIKKEEVKKGVNFNQRLSQTSPMILGSKKIRSNRRSYLRKENIQQWLPILNQLNEIGFDNVKMNITLLNRFEGDYLLVLNALSESI